MEKYIKKEGCPFCSEEVADITFLESTNFRVIYNHAPILPGHSLVIPKSHIESLLDLNESELFEFTQLSIKAAKLLLRAFKADSFNWTLQEKAPAGQTISHLHIHIFPRHENDLPNPGDWYPLLLSSEENKHIDSELRQKLSLDELHKIVRHLIDEANYLFN